MFLWCGMNACRKKDQQNSACGGTPSFSADIKPIFDVNCATSGCHDATTKAGGYDFSGYAGISGGVCGGRVLCSMRHEAGCSPMPRGGGKLPGEKIALVDCWRIAGCPNN